VKRISVFVLFILLIFTVSGLNAETSAEASSQQGLTAFLSPNIKVIIYVDYPESQPLKYTGNYIADLQNALLIRVENKLFFIRKEFIQKLSIVPDAYDSSLAMNALHD